MSKVGVPSRAQDPTVFQAIGQNLHPDVCATGHDDRVLQKSNTCTCKMGCVGVCARSDPIVDLCNTTSGHQGLFRQLVLSIIIDFVRWLLSKRCDIFNEDSPLDPTTQHVHQPYGTYYSFTSHVPISFKILHNGAYVPKSIEIHVIRNWL